MDFIQLENQTIVGTALSSAVQTGLIQQLEQPKSFEEIESPFSKRFLRSLLGLLRESGILQLNDGRFEVSAQTREAFNPGSRATAHFGRILAEMQRSHTVVGFKHDLRVPFRKSRPSRFFKFFRSPEEAQNFADYAGPFARTAGAELSRLFDFQNEEEIIDLGGNDGSFLEPILKVHPHLKGTVVDIKAVEPAALARANSSDLSERLRFYRADFFYDRLPSARLYLCGYVFHDWPDRFSERILKNLFAAIPVGGRLILHENLLDHPEPNVRREHTVFNHAIVAMGEARAGAAGERTSDEYREWLAHFGFAMKQVIHGSVKSFLVFERVAS